MADADIGVFGGSGFYSFVDDLEERVVSTRVRRPVRPDHHRHDRRPPRRLPSSPRPQAPSASAPRQLPRQRRRHARSRGPAAARAVRGRVAAADHPSRATSSWSTSSSTARRAGPTRSTTRSTTDRTTSRWPTRTTPTRAPCWSMRPRRLGITVHDGGTVVVVQGPRFSTRAESAWYRSAGWDVINMTQYPEAASRGRGGHPLRGRRARDRLRHRARRDAGRRARHAGAGVRLLRGQRPSHPRSARSRPSPTCSVDSPLPPRLSRRGGARSCVVAVPLSSAAGFGVVGCRVGAPPPRAVLVRRDRRSPARHGPRDRECASPRGSGAGGVGRVANGARRAASARVR